jgi:hypothetical protein
MDLVPTLISSGWASGVNAYLTVVLMSLLGRAGVGDVPEELQSDGVLVAAVVLYAIEFVVDKVPLLDSAWDVLHTAVRPGIAGAIWVARPEPSAWRRSSPGAEPGRWRSRATP